jgi:hypothetical protein
MAWDGAAFITVLHGVGEGRHGANGVAARAEATALLVHCGRKEKGAGSAWWAGSACLAAQGGWAGSACLAARGRAGWLGHWAD